MASGNGAIIDITVKTLDGQNRTFTVPENLNVRQFKEKISGSIEIPADTQRLIFQGRVMQDEKILKDYDIHGKVIHLVQRAPPTSLSSSSTSSSSTTSTASPGRHHGPMGNLFDVQIHLGRVQSNPTSREARARIRQAEFNLSLINDVLNLLEQRTGANAGDGPTTEGAETSRPYTTSRTRTPGEGQMDDSMDTSSPPGTGSASQSDSAGSRQQQQTGSGANQSGAEDAQGGLLATELADFLDRVLSTNNRIAPHIRTYRDYLRNEENYPASSREGRDAQEVVSRVTEVLHAVGHLMHSLSDVVVDMNTNIPRQAVASPPTPFPIPGSHNVAIPIHMNVRSRQNGNGGGQRQNQASSTTTTTGSTAPVSSTGPTAATQSTSTPTNNATANSSNTGHAAATAGPGSFQMPPVSVPLSTAGDPTVMVEVFPTGVTVHDIRAVVTPGAGDEDSESSNDSNDGLARNTANITIRSSATIEQPVSSTSTASSSSPTTTSSSASAQPLAASTGGTSTTTFSSSTSSTSSFTFSPTTSVSIGGMPNIGVGSVPNVPGLPPGLLQNILGSILNTHGVRPGHPVQVNVVQQMTASGGVGPHSHAPRPPHRERHQQPVQDLPVDSDRGQEAPARLDASLQTATNMEAGTGTHQNAATNTSCNITNAATNTTNSSNTVGTNTGGSSSNAATNTSRDGGMTSTNVATNSSGSTTFTSTINLGRASQGSSIGTRTDPNMGTSSRSTNTPRPHFHIHHGPPGPRAPPSIHTRPQMAGSVRPGGPGPGGRGYVDPYLPCSSPHYSTQTAMSAFRAIRNQMLARGQTMQQQQLQQQVPNLSTMVSGMVGDIIEQVGQAAQQALSTGTGSTSATTSTNTASSTTTAPSTATAANTEAGGNNNEGSSHMRPPAINPMEMFASMFTGPSGGGGTVGPIPFDIGAMIGNIMQMRNPPGPNVSNTASTAASAPPTSTSSSSPSSTTTAPGGATLADLFTQFRTATEGGDGDAAEVNVIVSLLEAVAPHMGLTDLFSLVMGNTRVLSQLRGPLREFVNSRVAQHGSVTQVVEVALNDMFPEIQHIESLVEVREGVDMARSIRTCLQSHLTTIFTAINSDNTGAQEEFGRHLYSLWMKMMAETIGLCVYCIRNGQIGFSIMVQRYMPRMTQGMNPAITIWMTTSLQDILGSFHRNHPVPESDIMGYVVRKPARPAEALGSGEQAASATSTTRSSSHVSAPPTATCVASSSATKTAMETSSPAPMDLSESPSVQAPRAKVARTLPDDETESADIFEDAQESLSGRPSAGTRPSTITTSRSAARDGATVGSAGPLRNGRGSDDWQTVIPQEWIPVINRDITRQQEQRSQQPFSDAYLQGLPAKRRRMMNLEHAGEMGNMPQYLPASLTRAARAAGVEPISSEENLTQEAADNLDLQAELEREMVSVLESRIMSDKDFNSDRFPNSKEYFHKSKRH